MHVHVYIFNKLVVILARFDDYGDSFLPSFNFQSSNFQKAVLVYAES